MKLKSLCGHAYVGAQMSMYAYIHETKVREPNMHEMKGREPIYIG